ncbi:hypothetical protein PAMC26577_00065 [Caballeronia sordidicola]|uniref:Uncharacterized protein n=1 Tax=Caballeronia sordidicola TaxID=196367 RepID=A0A242N835_CABSO|nr:hypothetical protein PAMC26577_00065 [Caballeronia sordidicola]
MRSSAYALSVLGALFRWLIEGQAGLPKKSAIFAGLGRIKLKTAISKVEWVMRLTRHVG